MAPIRYSLFVSLLFSLVLFLPLIHAKHKDVTYCDKGADYDVKVSGVEITPYPVSRGKTTTFSIAASTDKPIAGGKLIIEVAYYGWYIYSETDDLCGETSCPAAGNFKISHSQVLPGLTPPGSYTLKMTMTDGNENQLTCINFDFSIGWFAAAKAIADM